MRKTVLRALVTLCALSALGVAGVAVSTGDTTDRPAAIDDDPGLDPVAGDRARSIPTAVTPEARHACGPLPFAFDNTYAGYSLCYPETWGFLDLSEPAPQLELDGLEAASVRLADAGTFPWEPGVLPLDAVAGGATIIEVTTLPSFAPSSESGDCTPDESLSATARICELRIDPMSASPDETGSVLELLSVHELGGRVGVARAYLPATAEDTHRATVRQILATIKALDDGSSR